MLIPAEPGYSFSVPELPEVESARAVVERSALRRRIVDVDDTDSWVCRPHSPGELKDALAGHQLRAAHRRGKSIWCEVTGGAPVLGIHLGMSGRIHVSRKGRADDEGGDYVGTGGAAASARAVKPEWDRFTLVFADGGSLRLFDKRRLGRVRLDPDIDALGPDAGEVGLAELREALGRSHLPVKARLLDQHAIAGVGNLLADEALWQAAVDPRCPADELDRAEVAVLHRKLRRPSATRSSAAACTPARSSATAGRVATARAAARRCTTARSVAGRPGGARRNRSSAGPVRCGHRAAPAPRPGGRRAAPSPR